MGTLRQLVYRESFLRDLLVRGRSPELWVFPPMGFSPAQCAASCRHRQVQLCGPASPGDVQKVAFPPLARCASPSLPETSVLEFWPVQLDLLQTPLRLYNALSVAPLLHAALTRPSSQLALPPLSKACCEAPFDPGWNDEAWHQDDAPLFLKES